MGVWANRHTQIDIWGNCHGAEFISRSQSRARRYHMRYTRGVEAKGHMRDRLAELQRQSSRAERYPRKAFRRGDIAGDSRTQHRRELDSTLERWAIDRSEGEDQKKRPLLNSYGRRVIATGYEGKCKGETAIWQNWNAKSAEEQWSWLEALDLYPRRRQVLDSTEELGG